MSIQIPTNEPAEIIAGDTIKWKITDSDYPASAGWVLSYRLSNSTTALDIASTADGDTHSVLIAAATSANYAAGFYHFSRIFTKAAERYTTLKGQLQVKPNAAVLSALDSRTHARKMLDAIESALEGAATANDLHVLQVAGVNRSMSQDKTMLIKLRSQYQIEVRREESAAGIKTGRGKIFVRF